MESEHLIDKNLGRWGYWGLYSAYLQHLLTTLDKVSEIDKQVAMNQNGILIKS